MNVDDASDKPRWLTYLEGELEEGDELDGEDIELFGILRSLLEAPGDDETAAKEAAQRVFESYYNTWLPNDISQKEPNKLTTKIVLGQLARFSFELTTLMTYPSSELNRIANTIICVKGLGAQSFGLEDPAFNSFDEALGPIVEEFWNRSTVPPESLFGDELRTACDSSRSVGILFAKLLQAGLLKERGLEYAAFVLSEGVGKHRDEDIAKSDPPLQLSQRCKAEIASQYILIAGQTIKEEVKSPTMTYMHPLGEDEWKLWTGRFEEFVVSTPDDAEWGLKQHMQKAHDKMVELLPELFPGAQQV